MVLWTGCIGAWFRHLTRRQIDPRIWTDCKLYYFLFYFATDYSSMLLVLMSLEKCFAVYFPLKSKTVCTVKTAKWATGVVGVIMAGYNLIYIFVLKSSIIKSSGRHTCVYIGNTRVIVEAVDSVLYSFGPFTVMFITNFAIVFKFMGAKCKPNSTESTNQALVKAATRGTAMVVTVSVTFIILTAPTGVAYALSRIVQLEDIPLYRVFMNLTRYLNHSINGVLYIIVGSRFRMELFKLFCRKERLDNTTFSHSVNNTSHISISGSRFWLVWILFDCQTATDKVVLYCALLTVDLIVELMEKTRDHYSVWSLFCNKYKIYIHLKSLRCVNECIYLFVEHKVNNAKAR